MQITEKTISAAHQEQTRAMLHQLAFPVHRNGYKQLCIAIPLFALDPFQNLAKELYPHVADYLNFTDGCAVEHCIRDSILYAWKNGEPEVWTTYFPNLTKAPSNKRFLSTLAERLYSEREIGI